MKQKSSILFDDQSRSNILSQSSWWTLNKALTIEIGFDASLLLSDLVAKQEYFRRNNQLDEKGFFFNLKKDIQNDTSISESRQDRAVEVLKKFKLLDTVKKTGVPPRLFYKVNTKNVNNLIQKLHKD